MLLIILIINNLRIIADSYPHWLQYLPNYLKSGIPSISEHKKMRIRFIYNIMPTAAVVDLEASMYFSFSNISYLVSSS